MVATVPEQLSQLNTRVAQLEHQVRELREAAAPKTAAPPRAPVPPPWAGPNDRNLGASYNGPPTGNVDAPHGGSWGRAGTPIDGIAHLRDREGVIRIGGEPATVGPERAPLHDRAMDMIDAMLPVGPKPQEPQKG